MPSINAHRNSFEPCLSVVPVVVKDADGFCDGAWGASELPARAVSGGEGGQGRAAGPPGGAALTARSVAASTMSWEARQGFLCAGCYSCRTSFGLDVDRRMRASLLISALGARCGVGSKMAFGVSRREVVRPLVLGRLSNRVGSNKVAGAGRRSSTGGRRRTPSSGSSAAQAATAKAASPVVRSVW
jgi:hypothetical protein